jgi:SAM-dependent methyltransferase
VASSGYLWLVRRALRAHGQGAGGRLLDVGCGEKPFADCLSGVKRYIGLERLPQEGGGGVWPPPGCAQVVGDAARLPFRAGAFDTVLMTSVLHYQAQPQRCVEEMARVLAPGGRLLLCEPQLSRYHGAGDYFRFSRDGLAHLARAAGLEVVEVAAIGGFWLQHHQQLAFYLDARLPRLKPVRAAGRLVAALISRWGALVDRALPCPAFAMAHLLVARKVR